MAMKRYNINLNEDTINEARTNLEVGQSLSPIVDELIRQWNKKKKEEKL